MPGFLEKLLSTEFGVRTRASLNPLNAQIALAPTPLLSNNPDRLGWFLVNLGVNDAFIAFDRNVSTTRGIILSSGGGGVNFKWDEEFDLVGYELWGITTIGAVDIFLIEIVGIAEIP